MPKAFQTPPSLPESIVCRTLKIPSSKEWLGIFNSALLEMLSVYNWEQVLDTDLSIEETIELCQEILNEYWATAGCGDPDGCLLPDGSRILRLSATGHVQQLEGEEWVDPTGDYTVPPVPSRGESTPFSRRCNAAANAESVLRQTYEAATDAIASGLSDAEVVAAMVAVLLAAIGAWLGLVIGALIAMAYALFKAFVEIAEFMTIDLWDETFSDLLRCVLLECATDDATVVTFDFQCVREGMANAVNLTAIDAHNQLRLFGQVDFLLNVIGVDGLNAAGATTGVSGATCDDCAEIWCYRFDFTIDNQGWTIVDGARDSGGLYDGAGVADNLTIQIDFDETFVIDVHVEFNAEWTGSAPRWVIDETAAFTEPWIGELGGNQLVVFGAPLNIDMTSIAMNFDRYVGSQQHFDALRLLSVTMTGTGINPFGEDNCPEEEE